MSWDDPLSPERLTHLAEVFLCSAPDRHRFAHEMTREERRRFLRVQLRRLDIQLPEPAPVASIFGAGIPLPAQTPNAPRSLFAEGIDLS